MHDVRAYLQGVSGTVAAVAIRIVGVGSGGDSGSTTAGIGVAEHAAAQLRCALDHQRVLLIVCCGNLAR